MTAAVGATLIPGFPTAPNGTPIIPTCQYAPPTAAAYTLMYPAQTGGINWSRQAYDPATNDLYVCAEISAQGLGERIADEPQPDGDRTTRVCSGRHDHCARRLDEHDRLADKVPAALCRPRGPDVRNGSCASGDLTTAGGLLFVAENVGLFTEGTPDPVPAVLYAIDAKTGKRLWSWTNNQKSSSGREDGEAYVAKGRQYVAVMATSPKRGASATSPPTDHLTVFALPA